LSKRLNTFQQGLFEFTIFAMQLQEKYQKRFFYFPESQALFLKFIL